MEAKLANEGRSIKGKTEVNNGEIILKCFRLINPHSLNSVSTECLN